MRRAEHPQGVGCIRSAVRRLGLRFRPPSWVLRTPTFNTDKKELTLDQAERSIEG